MSDPEFPYLKIGRKGRWQKRNISNVSDGDQRHWPPRPAYRPSSDENYLIKLGQEWVNRDGVGMIGVQYYINALPHGYAVWEADSGDGTQAYKRLFGHPSEKYYDSIPTFLPHFLWLQDGMQDDCSCRLCGGKGTVATGVVKTRRPRNALDPSSIITSRMTRDITTRDSDVSTRESSTSGLATGRLRRDVKQSGAPYARDEEGTEDVYKPFVKRLEGARNSIRGTDDDIREPNSIDWRAEHEHGEYGTDTLFTHITQIEQQHSFVPRVGELVLWCPHFLDSHYLMFDCATSEYKYHSFNDKRFHGHPRWRAGVVTEVPSAITQNGPVDFPDILDDPDKRTSLNTAGFRVETMPDPNDPLNKSVSKQYKFIPLRNIRPLAQWQSILRGIPEKKLHTSIKNALTCMTSISLVEKFKAVGHWPSASIFCKGLFLGSELIVVGDTVRLASEKSTKCTDVLVIESIRLNLEDMEQDHILPKTPLLCSKSSITLVGTAYTLDKKSHYGMSAPDSIVDDDLEQVVVPTPVPLEVVKVVFHPVGSAEYGPWYRLHAENQKYQVSHEQVLGRLYEAEAVRLWTGLRQERRSDESTKAPSLDFDVSGIMSARQYATCADERLPEPQGSELLWFWADYRAQALDLATFNGLEVGRYHDIRDKDTLFGWREAMKVLNGYQPTSNIDSMYTSSFFLTGSRGRKPGSRLINGKVVLPGDVEYPSGAEAEDEAQGAKPKPKPSSQMAGAAVVSTDEESRTGDDDEDIEIVGEMRSPSKSEDMLAQSVNKPPPQAAKKPLTKAQIMSDVVDSIEEGQVFEDDVSEEEPDWEATVPVRGGTEESEGGDYKPKKFPWQELFGGRGKKSKYYYESDED